MSIKTSIETKALVAWLADNRTHIDYLHEYKLASTNMRGESRQYNQEQVLDMYNDKTYHGHTASGATKVAFLDNIYGNTFKVVLVKGNKSGANPWLGNQSKAEIEKWNSLVESNETDFVCPILKYWTTKSDRTSERKDMRKVRIVCQKAVEVCDMRTACELAERYNATHGRKGKSKETRLQELRNFASRHGLWDVESNAGNCGVIYDYHRKAYKAVIIDFAL